MTFAKIQHWIDAGETVSAVFWRKEYQSLIQVWKYEEDFILTWEEALDSDQYNENNYTRDDRHVFNKSADVISYLKDNAVEVEYFDKV